MEVFQILIPVSSICLLLVSMVFLVTNKNTRPQQILELLNSCEFISVSNLGKFNFYIYLKNNICNIMHIIV